MSSAAAPAISVLIPTRAAAERRESLARAIESVVCQQDVSARAIVIVNGAATPSIADAYRAHPRVRVLTRADADLPAAYREGMRTIDTPYFATLDDDDLLMPGALKVRHAALERQPGCTVVVTNGLRRENGRDTLHVDDGRNIEGDPFGELLRGNWMLPGSWLCRTTALTRALFDAMPRHLECTYLCLRFAMLGMTWVREPTVIYHVGSPLSASRSRAYAEGQAGALRQLLQLDLPPHIRRALRGRIAAAHHRVANLALETGDLRGAWRWHLATLRDNGGWRHLPFLRHLVLAPLRGRRRT